MKKIWILVLAIGLVLSMYFLFFYKTAEAPQINTEEEKPVENITFSTSSKQIIKDTYEVNFTFPVTGQEKIDSEVSKIVDDLINNFEKEAISFSPHPSGEERKYTLFADFDEYLGSKYDTFVFLFSVDFGGAHPNHFYRTITFDKNKEVVSLEKFLNDEFGGLAVLDKISQLVAEKITNKLGENANQQMIDDGTKPSVENFDNFYVDGENVVFLFEPYAVAPYAYSSQEAKISFSEIRN